MSSCVAGRTGQREGRWSRQVIRSRSPRSPRLAVPARRRLRGAESALQRVGPAARPGRRGFSQAAGVRRRSGHLRRTMARRRQGLTKRWAEAMKRHRRTARQSLCEQDRGGRRVRPVAFRDSRRGADGLPRRNLVKKPLPLSRAATRWGTLRTCRPGSTPEPTRSLARAGGSMSGARCRVAAVERGRDGSAPSGAPASRRHRLGALRSSGVVWRDDVLSSPRAT